jgi:two-component system response regulator YesN
MNIFIVEDEYWALEEMKALLKVYQTEHNLYFYDNGEDAFGEVSIHKPEMIVTDITMPGMDGLELVQKVLDVDPTTKCIILTVHDTFDYAKKGIQLGVVDYLLKPLKKDALYQTMDTTIETIQKRKQEEIEKQHWSINQLLFNTLAKDNQDYEVFEYQPFVFLYVLLGNWHAPVSEEMSQINVKKVFEHYGQGQKIWYFSLDKQRKLLLVSGKDATPMSKLPISKLFNTLREMGQVHLCFLKKNANTKLMDAYQKTHQLMEKQKCYGESTLITEDKKEDGTDLEILWTTVRVIEKQIRQGELASISQQTKYLLTQIQKVNVSQRQLFQFLLDMYYAILYNLQQTNSRMMKLENIDEMFAKLDCLLTFQELEEWLEELINKIVSAYTPQEIAPKHLIPEVKHWIAESYAESITFQQFADEHHVSLSYLSREFKEQTKMNFSKYLINYRVRKAKELFQNGLDRTMEVGSLVGYNDPKHFRAVFKKVTGKTPKEFKDSL